MVQFLRQAARDPAVVAIKQTLYRTSQNSPIVAGADRGGGGRQVGHRDGRAQGPLRRGSQHPLGARPGARRRPGGLRLRRAEDPRQGLAGGAPRGRALRTYVHFGTGNYHPITAKIYTDLSLLHLRPGALPRRGRLFNYMTGYATPETLEKIAIAPLGMRDAARLIERGDRATPRPASRRSIWVKLNSLVDRELIDALYRASQAGVQIDLVMRGICCLRPGVPGLSENIRVKSIVGRFLEHCRIICFGNGHSLPSPEAKVFISSADWMPRNLDWRVETLVPIENPTVHQQVLDQIMVANLKDKAQSWMLAPDGTYQRVARRRGRLQRARLFHDQSQPLGPRQRAQGARSAGRPACRKIPMTHDRSAQREHFTVTDRQGAPARGRVGVIDLGSNSIRLVVYDGLCRAPIPLFNEKVLCGLGRGLSHRPAQPGRRRAGARQPRALPPPARGMKVRQVEVLATAAVRDADNGAAFVERSAAHRPQGPRDLRHGGGAAVGPGRALRHARRRRHDGRSRRRQAGAGGARRGADRRAGDTAARPLPPDGGRAARVEARAWWMRTSPGCPGSPAKGRDFYPVGGGWRALARIHMAQGAIPSTSSTTTHDARRRGTPRSRPAQPGVAGADARHSARRAETLPFAALVLERLLRAPAGRVVFSAHGLREGCSSTC